jgi:mRNA-degrading endonuclease YafQ of YafQ-DinJ toxin-antitoxin module
MKISYTPHFARLYGKLSGNLQDETDIALELFKNDPANVRLRVHKLNGRLADYWSFSVNYNYRVVFRYGGKNEALLTAIGNHDVYK